jgi:cyanate lyase
MNDAKTILGHKILSIKKQKGLSWEEIATAIGHAAVWTCAGLDLRRLFRPDVHDRRYGGESNCSPWLGRCRENCS